MNIAILGGCFDPPHIGHWLVIRQVLEIRSDIDKLLLVPAFQHQWKPIFASPSDRLNMLSPFAQQRVEVSDIEIVRRGISYTIDTIKHMRSEIKGDVLWIVGSDILAEFDRWEKREELARLASFLIFPRDPYNLPQKLPPGFEAIRNKDILTTNFSSTAIRERVKKGKSITYLVPKEVETYIYKHKLYA